MLTIYSSASAPQVWHSGIATLDAPVWIDLIDPNAEERQQAERLLGAGIPTRDQTSAIELSNRLRASEKTLRLNIPSFVRADGEDGPLTPLGFVVTPPLLATVRYAESLSFKNVADSFGKSDAPDSGVDVFVDLLQNIVNVGADRIEEIAANLSKLSQTVFAQERNQRRLLRGALFQVGAMQRQITQIRAALLGVSRVVAYLSEVAPPWIEDGVHRQFRTFQADIGSLSEFEQQLSDRLQFLLDAVLGFINNDQNDIMRVLTIVSVATMPPMILAGIWGMNFKSMPELNWQHGYAFALATILLSILLPLVWFKIKGWL